MSVDETRSYPLPSLNNPVYVVPLSSEGFVITVNAGGYVMTGLTVTLTLTLNENPAPASPVVVTLTPLTVQSGSGLTASYTTVGGEFTTAGLYDARLEVKRRRRSTTERGSIEADLGAMTPGSAHFLTLEHLKGVGWTGSPRLQVRSSWRLTRKRKRATILRSGKWLRVLRRLPYQNLTSR